MAETSTFSRLIAEFVGTYLLVFTVGCNVATGSPLWAVTSIACVLMVMVYALGGVSGGNFNPAVSIALGLAGKSKWSEVGVYCVVQCVAGVAAGIVYSLLTESFVLMPGKGYGWWEAMLVEVLYTCLLCFVVLNVAASKRTGCDTGNQFYGLAIGFVVIAGGYAAGHISGGAFNPAVALGVDFSSALFASEPNFLWGPIYALYEFIGAVLAVFLFRLVRPDDFSDASADDFEWSFGVWWLMKLASEFIGTYFLVLTVGLNVIGKSPAPVFSVAASLMVLVYSLGSCSSAHFNPAVTVAVLLTGRGVTDITEATAYIVVQMLGGIAGAFTYAWIEHGQTFALKPEANSWSAIGAAELVYSFVLCFVVLSVCTVRDPLEDGDGAASEAPSGPPKKLTQYFGLAIASCVTAGGYAIGSISGGSLNPAVSVGVSFSHAFLGHGSFFACLFYTAVELAGAGLAAAAFMLTRPGEFLEDKPLP